MKKRDGLIIALSCTSNWYYYLIIDLYSLLECTKNIKKIYLLLDTDKVSEVKYLNLLISKYKKVEFVLIDVKKHLHYYLLDKSPNKNTIFSDFCFSRLMLPDLVDEDKVLYIDTDAIVVKDISTVWNYDISNYYLAGIKDYGVIKNGTYERMNITGKYVNSGFVVLNLKKFREDNIHRKCFELINNKKMNYPDQDALNNICQHKTLYLPSTYNSCEYEHETLSLDVVNRDMVKVFHFPGKKLHWLADRYNGEEWYEAEDRFINEFIKDSDE